jgi:hypothetical protein
MSSVNAAARRCPAIGYSLVVLAVPSVDTSELVSPGSATQSGLANNFHRLATDTDPNLPDATGTQTPLNGVAFRRRTMGRTLIAAAFVITLAIVPVGRAWAQSPHFIIARDALSSTDAEDLFESFKEAGLGNDVTINYTASANGTATYACINGGGSHPQASNKETVNGPVSASGSFNSGKNGTISASLTVEEPSAGSFSCPNGQSLVLGSVSYTDVQICDTVDNMCVNLPNVSRTFCDVDNLTKATVNSCLVPN